MPDAGRHRMKRFSSLLVMAILIYPSTISAQEQQQLQSPKGRAQSPASTPGLTAPTVPKKPAPEELLKPKLVYSGFVVELSRTDKPLKLLSLRKPVDLKHDADNLYLHPRTGQPIGF